MNLLSSVCAVLQPLLMTVPKIYTLLPLCPQPTTDILLFIQRLKFSGSVLTVRAIFSCWHFVLWNLSLQFQSQYGYVKIAPTLSYKGEYEHFLVVICMFVFNIGKCFWGKKWWMHMFSLWITTFLLLLI